MFETIFLDIFVTTIFLVPDSHNEAATRTMATSNVNNGKFNGSKPWKLEEEETFSSFNAWKTTLMIHVNGKAEYRPFTNCTWLKYSSSNPTRGFTSDPTTDPPTGLTAVQKAENLSMMLGLITTFVPHFLSNSIVRDSTSLDSVWQFIRKYYGFKQSEGNFMKYYSIRWEEGERPERLYQRLLAHLQDNLLTRDGKIQHDGECPTVDEDMSATVERLCVLRWMDLIHPGLINLVTRTFANDLLNKSLKDMQPQIVDALDGLLDELRANDSSSASRVAYTRNSTGYSGKRNDSSRKYKKWQGSKDKGRKSSSKSFPPSTSAGSNRQYPMSLDHCRICEAEGRSSNHHLSKCDFMCRAEKRQFFKSNRVEIQSEDNDSSKSDESQDEQISD